MFLGLVSIWLGRLGLRVRQRIVRLELYGIIHQPVFRIGGDEFAALLMDRDYQNRDELLRLFDKKCLEKRRQNSDAWEQVDVARGMAVYDQNEDESVSDVVRRADKTMYENKWESKRQTAAEVE